MKVEIKGAETKTIDASNLDNGQAGRVTKSDTCSLTEGTLVVRIYESVIALNEFSKLHNVWSQTITVEPLPKGTVITLTTEN